eukprot:NODE_19_length_47148_cov_1.447810.p37 type:complete len:150 gc:universal NODE_19_length_47148_cov_1.447810:32398-32847(+)
MSHKESGATSLVQKFGEAYPQSRYTITNSTIDEVVYHHYKLEDVDSSEMYLTEEESDVSYEELEKRNLQLLDTAQVKTPQNYVKPSLIQLDSKLGFSTAENLKETNFPFWGYIKSWWYTHPTQSRPEFSRKKMHLKKSQTISFESSINQ